MTSFFSTPMISPQSNLFSLRKEHHDPQQESKNRALKYEQVCLITDTANIGTGTLIGRVGQVLYVLTAARCIREGSTAIFSTKCGQKITCQGIAAFFPKFGPREFFLPKLNNDIAIALFQVPLDTLFNIKPLELASSTVLGVKVYNASFVGYGDYGINGAEDLKTDGYRRQGQVHVIEYQNEDTNTWTCMTIVKDASTFLNNYFIPCPVEWKEPAGYMVAPLTIRSNKLEKRNLKKSDVSSHLLDTVFTLKQKNKLRRQRAHNDTFFLTVLPGQLLPMPGDSGGPLIVYDQNKPMVAGIAYYLLTKEEEHEEETDDSYCPYYTTLYTPVGYYYSWISKILSGAAIKKTKKFLIHPRVYMGLFYSDVLEITLHSGETCTIYLSFQKTHHEGQHKKIQYLPWIETVQIEEERFSIAGCHYDTSDDLEAAFLESKLVASVFYSFNQLCPLSLLIKILKEDLFILFDHENYYTPIEFESIFRQFYDRYSELMR